MHSFVQQGKHTIFGKVTGDTIFNVLRMGEVRDVHWGGKRNTACLLACWAGTQHWHGCD